MASGVAHSLLDTSLVPAAQRFALFKTALSVSHDVERVADDAQPFAAYLDAWMIGGMLVTAGRQGASRIVRDEHRIRTDGLDHLTFMHLLEGRTTGVAGRNVDCGPGDTLVLDTRAAMDVTTTANRNIGLRLPRSALSAVGVNSAGLNGLVLRGAAGALLESHVAALVRHAHLITTAEIGLLERATAAVVGECLLWAGAGAGASLDEDARRRAADLIESALGDPRLDAAAIARATGLSRSVLYRAFPGGIARYLLGRRLDRALALLTDPGSCIGVAEAAFAVGFTDPSYFSTAFRRRFGATASDVRRSGPAAAHNGLTGAYRQWVTSLGSGRGETG